MLSIPMEQSCSKIPQPTIMRIGLSFVFLRQKSAIAKKMIPRILRLDKLSSNVPDSKNMENIILSPATAIIDTTTGRSVPRISCMIFTF